MSTLRLLALIALAGLASCAPVTPGDDVVSGARTPIIFGQVETGYPSVVAVYATVSASAGGLCTGTIIGPHAVLTAKHCVFEDLGRGSYRAIGPGSFSIIFTSNVNDRASIRRVVGVFEVRTTPGTNVDRDVSNGTDLAVLLTNENLGGDITPIARSGPTSGTDITLVGFGRTSRATMDSGVKYRGTARVTRVGGALIESVGPSFTCQGDSGGPALDTNGAVTGVTSFGFGNCNSSYHTRVANPQMLAIIDDALRFDPPCVPAPEVCNGVDDDCDGMIDPGCAPLGGPCTTDTQCSGGRCEDVGGTRRCVRDCDPTRAIPPCFDGFYCEVRTGCAMGRCVAGAPGPKADGETCTADTECASNRCATFGATKRCGRACGMDPTVCGSTGVCEMTAGATCGTCTPFELSTQPRPFGAPCTTSAQCSDAMCVGGFCTRSCGAGQLLGCPGGWRCRAGMCVMGDPSGPGGPCQTTEDCARVAPDCVPVDGERVCAATCTSAADCGEGFTCESGPDAGASAGHCVRAGAPLGAECNDSSMCRSSICAGNCTRICDTNMPCPAGFSCDPAGNVSGCFPLPPAPTPTPMTMPKSGCGCVAVGAPVEQGWLLVIGCAGLALARRRRR